MYIFVANVGQVRVRPPLQKEGCDFTAPKDGSEGQRRMAKLQQTTNNK